MQEIHHAFHVSYRGDVQRNASLLLEDPRHKFTIVHKVLAILAKCSKYVYSLSLSIKHKHTQIIIKKKKKIGSSHHEYISNFMKKKSYQDIVSCIFNTVSVVYYIISL